MGFIGADQVQALTKSAQDTPNLPVRTAAAEARGTLNLPPDQAKNLKRTRGRR